MVDSVRITLTSLVAQPGPKRIRAYKAVLRSWLTHTPCEDSVAWTFDLAQAAAVLKGCPNSGPPSSSPRVYQFGLLWHGKPLRCIRIESERRMGPSERHHGAALTRLQVTWCRRLPHGSHPRNSCSGGRRSAAIPRCSPHQRATVHLVRLDLCWSSRIPFRIGGEVAESKVFGARALEVDLVFCWLRTAHVHL